MKFFYSVGIQLYGLAILIASLFNEKARKWFAGRKGIFKQIAKALANNSSPVIWFHCASLGEFEQGRPIIEAFRQKNPTYKIVLTFFSPSGYEVRKNYAGADYVFYLPLDTASNAKQFVEIVKPRIAIFVKYEFWFNYLTQLNLNNMPTYLVSAKFRADQYFFKWYGSWFKKRLNLYRKIFVQDTESEKLLRVNNISNVELAGDTRFDRVIEIATQAKTNDIIEAFKGNAKLWICGSTWEPDEKYIQEVFIRLKESVGNLKLLIVPHEIGEKHIAQVTELFKAKKYSEVDINSVKNSEVLVVDKMGMLSSLYKYADIVYIGGGFGKNIHNLPEAAVFGVPVLFGPNHAKFTEAFDLLAVKGGFTINGAGDLFEKMNMLLKDAALLKQSGQAAKDYIYRGSGATQKILAELESVKA